MIIILILLFSIFCCNSVLIFYFVFFGLIFFTGYVNRFLGGYNLFSMNSRITGYIGCAFITRKIQYSHKFYNLVIIHKFLFNLYSPIYFDNVKPPCRSP